MDKIDLKAIIFDYGNVLSLPPSDQHLREMARLLKIPLHDGIRAYSLHRACYDSGVVTPQEYWRSVAGLDASSTSETLINTLMQLDYRMWTQPNKTTISWVQTLRKNGLRIGLLSNMPSDHRQYLDDHCSWLPQFDHRTFSGDVGCAKPNPSIYEHSLSGLNVSPSEALFIDDNADNIKVAANLGLNVILFTCAEDVARKLYSGYGIRVSCP